MLSRRQILTAAIAAPAALALTPAFAAEPPVYQSGGVAINGYDPVAYFTESQPVEGSADFTSTYEGATFQFASAENKAMFDSAPAQYAPQYGGYCAWAVSKGYTASTSPNAWSVHKGKLYLNFNKAVRARWSISKDANIEAGDANWPKVLG